MSTFEFYCYCGKLLKMETGSKGKIKCPKCKQKHTSLFYKGKKNAK
ncbi:hypothetical protein LCGC14_0306260 [marine sediment metagenome]|uniref:Uncharacterized protein n=1 Tax=marine sediment metagenome TaxID=412755 RepID=A0A0F9U694_9ZZZZ